MATKKRSVVRKSLRRSQRPFLFSWSKQPSILGDVQVNLQIVSRIAGVLVLLLGCIVLIDWYIRIPLLNNVSFVLTSMSANTAVAFIFAGIALVLSHRLQFLKALRILRDICSLSVYLIGSLTIFEYIFSIDIGIDQLFLQNPLTQNSAELTHRMHLITAVMLTLSGAALFLLDRKIKQKYYSQHLALISGVILVPTFIAYVYHIDFIYGLGVGTKIAVHTAVGLLLVSIGIIFARPTRGFMQLIISSSAGGYLSRRLLLFSVIGPFLLSYLFLLGFNAKFYDVEFRFLLLTLSCIILFTYLIWRTAHALHRIDILKRQAEGDIQFLSQAGKVLVSSINYRETLRTIAKLSVSYLCDYCGIDMFGEDGNASQIVLSGKDKKKEKIISDIRKKNLNQIYVSSNFTHAITTKHSVLIPEVTDAILIPSIALKRDLQKLKQLGMSSIMIVPITLHNKVIGIMQFISLERVYTQFDIANADELANRVALAVENAKLFNDLNHALKLRDEFISIVSHELKTPITTLKVYTQIMQKQFSTQKNSPTLTYLGKMESQVNKLTILIQDLLDVTKMQVGKLAFTVTTFDVNQLVKEIVEDLQAITSTHSISIQGKVTTPMQGDRDRIGQVLINLLTNAIKYSPDAKKIQVIVSESKEYVLLSVQDFGIGIDKNYIAKIFDRFYQVKEGKRHFAGLGMGLYIAKEIALRHGGDLTVRSQKGKGSVFTLSLPKSEHAMTLDA